MKQPHTEASIDHTDGEQNTGNHKKPGVADAGGADKVGGTRAGAGNVEPGSGGKAESIESGTDVDKVSALDAPGSGTKTDDGSRERHPERDEHGRL